jgi:radical SAM protein
MSTGIQTTGYRPARGGSYLSYDFARTPFTVAWEITRACALACVHCRAMAIPRRDPRELTTLEGFHLIDQVVELGRPILVITGGDPMMRRDVFDLLGYAVDQGLRVGFSPSATGRLTRPALERVREIGVSMVHISLDGSAPVIHDGFRRVRGSFQRTIRILADIVDLGIPLQIGTTVSRHNLHDLPRIAERVASVGATVWSIFFLVPTGRAAVADMITPAEHEQVFQWLADLAEKAPFHVRTTAAPAFRRVMIERMRARSGAAAPFGSPDWQLTGAGYSFRLGDAPDGRGVNDGNGFCFISHVGDVCPSGFLQISAGNVRERSLVEIYRESPLFTALRNPALLKGKCGRCWLRAVCGGSRARAYALTGDYLAADPSCVYEPPVDAGEGSPA